MLQKERERERETERYQDGDRDKYRQRDKRERENEADKDSATERESTQPYTHPIYALSGAAHDGLAGLPQRPRGFAWDLLVLPGRKVVTPLRLCLAAPVFLSESHQLSVGQLRFDFGAPTRFPHSLLLAHIGTETQTAADKCRDGDRDGDRGNRRGEKERPRERERERERERK